MVYLYLVNSKESEYELLISVFTYAQHDFPSSCRRLACPTRVCSRLSDTQMTL